MPSQIHRRLQARQTRQGELRLVGATWGCHQTNHEQDGQENQNPRKAHIAGRETGASTVPPVLRVQRLKPPRRHWCEQTLRFRLTRVCYRASKWTRQFGSISTSTSSQMSVGTQCPQKQCWQGGVEEPNASFSCPPYKSRDSLPRTNSYQTRAFGVETRKLLHHLRSPILKSLWPGRSPPPLQPAASASAPEAKIHP